MNAQDVLNYGHLTLLGTIDGVSPEDAERSGACGVWSIRQLVAHLSSYEEVFADVLAGQGGAASCPALDRFLAMGAEFNDTAVAERDGLTFEETLAEYTRHYENAMGALAQIPTARLSQNETIPWYGDEYSLDDLIVYQQYGHKREHSGQIGVFRGNMGF